MMGLVKKGPDVANAAKVGEPSLADPEPVAATAVDPERDLRSGGHEREERGSGDREARRQPAADATSAPPADPNPGGRFAFWDDCHRRITPPGAADPNELKPTAPADPNELKPTDTAGDQALPPPPQVNEIQQDGLPRLRPRRVPTTTPGQRCRNSPAARRRKRRG